MSWFVRGILGGIRTMRRAVRAESAPGTTPGLPTSLSPATAEQRALEATCPTNAIIAEDGGVRVREERCVHCMRCSPAVTAAPLPWRDDVAWVRGARQEIDEAALRGAFRRSIHVRVVDAGDCGSCLSELMHLDDPLYNMHRLGIFVTPTPRQADVLVVVGPVTEQMRSALLEAYDAMPEPKRVLAIGACASSGGIFGPSFTSAAGASDDVPVDLMLPGCPPPPLAILDALLALTGDRKR